MREGLPPDAARFDLTPAEASRLQDRLRPLLELDRPVHPSEVRLVAAADVSYDRGDDWTYAALVVCRYPSLEVVEAVTGRAPARFPYVPGLLAFREAPVVLELWGRLREPPDVLLVDGHGIAHPRGFGIASHLGLLLGLPTIGVAKSVLVGEYREPSARRGSGTRLVHEGRAVGRALRTREATRPLFVSPGNLVDSDSAARFVLSCCRRYRMPEPSRAAHRLCNEARLAG